ncbi:2-oxoadipate dioxygenase/decarboxylase HglS [Psychrobacter aestuarii]|uniref:2-oxoadipate dioxygenase/decarboxylase n=1 Tax=Psychrobacter aestuarii TaxID=556327 RepID=A0ABN0VRS6_9GAMM|nr:VOC family protein [Psychrobacter aestuarii]
MTSESTHTPHDGFVSRDTIRHAFSVAMSEMYQAEVPLYQDLLTLVADVNEATLAQDAVLAEQLAHTGELPRLDMERHGAIRLGTADELAMMRRLFAVMGMYPVGYYDLAPASVPVHSTAFRALDSESLNHSPFRVFTSLLRLDLIDDTALRAAAKAALDARNIFTDEAVALIEQCERDGGLTAADSARFVKAALETFRWHKDTPISKTLYQQLSDQHRLIADVVGFKGPHINHLTPRTLDIDAVQQGMAARGIPPKAIIEGPPRRQCPILLRQTSFKALQEAVSFRSADGTYEAGEHTARFGEIEQRGAALTAKGRALYDRLLAQARTELGAMPNEDNAEHYMQLLSAAFSAFPDDYRTLHDEGLAYFYYQPVPDAADKDTLAIITEMNSDPHALNSADMGSLLDAGALRIEPIVYEDFLPVSAAGIFQSNLQEDNTSAYTGASNKDEFEQALGAPVYDEMALYTAMQDQSLAHSVHVLQGTAERTTMAALS